MPRATANCKKSVKKFSLRMLEVVPALMLGGCETLALTTLGIGGSAAVNHQMSNTPSRTFRRMGIEAGEVKKIDTGEVITARAGNREIEVELESVTAQTRKSLGV